jgi:hypothetical protein
MYAFMCVCVCVCVHDDAYMPCLNLQSVTVVVSVCVRACAHVRVGAWTGLLVAVCAYPHTSSCVLSP